LAHGVGAYEAPPLLGGALLAGALLLGGALLGGALLAGALLLGGALLAGAVVVPVDPPHATNANKSTHARRIAVTFFIWTSSFLFLFRVPVYLQILFFII